MTIKQIGDNIKYFRISKNLSRNNLSESLGISPSTLANYENNNRRPSLEMINKISNALDISTQELFENTSIDFSYKPLNNKSGFLDLIVTLYNLNLNKDAFTYFVENDFDSSQFNLEQLNFIKLVDKKIEDSNKLANSLDFLEDINLSMDNTITLRKTIGQKMSESEKDILTLLTSSNLEAELGYNFDDLAKNPKLLDEIIIRIHQIIKTEINIYQNK